MSGPPLWALKLVWYIVHREICFWWSEHGVKEIGELYEHIYDDADEEDDDDDDYALIWIEGTFILVLHMT